MVLIQLPELSCVVSDNGSAREDRISTPFRTGADRTRRPRGRDPGFGCDCFPHWQIARNGADRMKRLHLSSVLLIAVALILCATAGADSITLKNGGVIRGELRTDSKTAEKKTTVAIRTHSGAIVVVDRDGVEAVSHSAPAFQRDSARKVSARRRVAPVVLAVSNGPASAAEKEWSKRVKQWQGGLTGDYPQ